MDAQPADDELGTPTDDADFAACVAALRAAMEEIRAGKTRPLKDVLADIAASHGISL